MKLPLVTVVVAYRNEEAYIGKTIESICEQNYPYIELIIADDASNDGSSEVVKKTLNKEEKIFAGFKRIKTKRQIGIAKIINEAVNISSGVYVCVVYGKDMIVSKHVSAMVDALIARGRSVAFSDTILLTSQNNDIQEAIGDQIEMLQRDWVYESCIMLASMSANPSVCIGNLCIKRSIWNKIGGYRLKAQIRDWDIFLRLTLESEPIYVPKAGYKIRIETKDSRRIKYSLREKKEVLNHLYTQLKKGRYDNEKISAHYNEIKKRAFDLGHQELWQRAGTFGGRILWQARWKAIKPTKTKKQR